jgi:hypothetical protein
MHSTESGAFSLLILHNHKRIKTSPRIPRHFNINAEKNKDSEAAGKVSGIAASPSS